VNNTHPTPARVLLNMDSILSATQKFIPKSHYLEYDNKVAVFN